MSNLETVVKSLIFLKVEKEAIVKMVQFLGSDFYSLCREGETTDFHFGNGAITLKIKLNNKFPELTVKANNIDTFSVMGYWYPTELKLDTSFLSPISLIELYSACSETSK